MKKLLLTIVLTAGIFTNAMAASTVEFTVGSSTVNVKETEITEINLNNVVYESEGRTFIYAVDAENILGVKVTNEESAVTVSKNDMTISFDLQNNKAFVGDKEKDIDVFCMEKDNAIMLPLRFVAENLGYCVLYTGALDKIIISDKPAVINVNGQDVIADELELYYNLNKQSIESIPPETSDEEKTAYKNGIKKQILDMAKEINIVYQTAIEGGFNTIIDNAQSKEKIKADVDAIINENKDINTLSGVLAMAIEKSNVASEYMKVASLSVAPADEEISNLYNTQYITAKHILIPVVNTETNEPLSESDVKKAKQQADDILKKIKKGEDFDKLMKEFSKDTGIENFPNGYTFTKNEMVKPFEDTAFALKENEVSEIVTSDYGYHIIKRMPLASLDDNAKQSISQSVSEEKFAEFYDGIIKEAEVKIDDSAMDLIN